MCSVKYLLKFVVAYLIFVMGTCLMGAYAYGLSTVNGQLVVFFSLFAGFPAAYKMTREFSQIYE
jgi:hypothetical protein